MMDLEIEDRDLPDDEAVPEAGGTASVWGRVFEGFFDLLELLSHLLP